MKSSKTKIVTGTDEQGMFCISRPKLKPADLLILALLFLALFSNGQTVSSKDGKVYTTVQKAKTTKQAVNTGKLFRDSKGNEYPIMKTDSAYYVLRTSAKSGRQYKQYLKLN